VTQSQRRNDEIQRYKKQTEEEALVIGKYLNTREAKQIRQWSPEKEDMWRQVKGVGTELLGVDGGWVREKGIT
jgi:hypothetical protein